jgi:hypothetical protein
MADPYYHLAHIFFVATGSDSDRLRSRTVELANEWPDVQSLKS